MPETSRFLGIIVTMYYDDHDDPHFHVRYGSIKARIAIDSLAVVSGSLPPRIRGLVIEWAAWHNELRRNWRLARQQQPLTPIEPLE